MDERWLISTGELTELFGVSRQALTNWGRAGCPKYDRGKWYLPDVLQWFRGNRDSPVASGEKESMRDRKLRADTEYREERARRERVLREALEGLYFLKTEVEKAWAARALEAKAGFLLLEKTLPMELVGKDEEDMETIIADRVREVLSDYARAGKYTPDSEQITAGNTGVDAAKKDKSKRMGGQKPNSRRKNKRNAGKVAD